MTGWVKRKISNRVMSVYNLFDREKRALTKLSHLPRYTKGSFSLNGKEINFPDAASFRFMYRELFQEQIYLFNAESNSPYIIDCGANIGMSVIYFKKLYPDSKIIAFEPEKGIFGYLSRNVAAFGLRDIELNNKAVWKEETILKFNNEGADASRISDLDEITKFNSTYDVQAVRLSEYIDRP